MPLRKAKGSSTSGEGITLRRWVWLLIFGFAVVILQLSFDPVSDVINGLLQRPDISLYTGLGPFLRFLSVVWGASGWCLVVGGIIDLVVSRKRS